MARPSSPDELDLGRVRAIADELQWLDKAARRGNVAATVALLKRVMRPPSASIATGVGQGSVTRNGEMPKAVLEPQGEQETRAYGAGMGAAARMASYRQRLREGKRIYHIEADAVMVESLLIAAGLLPDATDLPHEEVERALATLIELLPQLGPGDA